MRVCSKRTWRYRSIQRDISKLLVKLFGLAIYATLTNLIRSALGVEEVMKATNNKGVDIIIDFIGAAYFQQNLAAVAKDGIIVNLGMMGGRKLPEGVDVSAFVLKRCSYVGSSLRSRDEEYQGKLRDQLVEHAMPRFKDGRFKLFVDRILPWEQIQDAHRLLEENKTKGKVICTIA